MPPTPSSRHTPAKPPPPIPPLLRLSLYRSLFKDKIQAFWRQHPTFLRLERADGHAAASGYPDQKKATDAFVADVHAFAKAKCGEDDEVAGEFAAECVREARAEVGAVSTWLESKSRKEDAVDGGDGGSGRRRGGGVRSKTKVPLPSSPVQDSSDGDEASDDYDEDGSDSASGDDRDSESGSEPDSESEEHTERDDDSDPASEVEDARPRHGRGTLNLTSSPPGTPILNSQMTASQIPHSSPCVRHEEGKKTSSLMLQQPPPHKRSVAPSPPQSDPQQPPAGTNGVTDKTSSKRKRASVSSDLSDVPKNTNTVEPARLQTAILSRKTLKKQRREARFEAEREEARRDEERQKSTNDHTNFPQYEPGAIPRWPGPRSRALDRLALIQADEESARARLSLAGLEDSRKIEHDDSTDGYGDGSGCDDDADCVRLERAEREAEKKRKKGRRAEKETWSKKASANVEHDGSTDGYDDASGDDDNADYARSERVEREAEKKSKKGRRAEKEKWSKKALAKIEHDDSTDGYSDASGDDDDAGYARSKHAKEIAEKERKKERRAKKEEKRSKKASANVEHDDSTGGYGDGSGGDDDADYARSEHAKEIAEKPRKKERRAEKEKWSKKASAKIEHDDSTAGYGDGSGDDDDADYARSEHAKEIAEKERKKGRRAEKEEKRSEKASANVEYDDSTDGYDDASGDDDDADDARSKHAKEIPEKPRKKGRRAGKEEKRSKKKFKANIEYDDSTDGYDDASGDDDDADDARSKHAKKIAEKERKKERRAEKEEKRSKKASANVECDEKTEEQHTRSDHVPAAEEWLLDGERATPPGLSNRQRKAWKQQIRKDALATPKADKTVQSAPEQTKKSKKRKRGVEESAEPEKAAQPVPEKSMASKKQKREAVETTQHDGSSMRTANAPPYQWIKDLIREKLAVRPFNKRTRGHIDDLVLARSNRDQKALDFARRELNALRTHMPPEPEKQAEWRKELQKQMRQKSKQSHRFEVPPGRETFTFAVPARAAAEEAPQMSKVQKKRGQRQRKAARVALIRQSEGEHAHATTGVDQAAQRSAADEVPEKSKAKKKRKPRERRAANASLVGPPETMNMDHAQATTGVDQAAQRSAAEEQPEISKQTKRERRAANASLVGQPETMNMDHAQATTGVDQAAQRSAADQVPEKSTTRKKRWGRERKAARAALIGQPEEEHAHATTGADQATQRAAADQVPEKSTTRKKRWGRERKAARAALVGQPEVEHAHATTGVDQATQRAAAEEQPEISKQTKRERRAAKASVIGQPERLNMDHAQATTGVDQATHNPSNSRLPSDVDETAAFTFAVPVRAAAEEQPGMSKQTKRERRAAKASVIGQPERLNMDHAHATTGVDQATHDPSNAKQLSGVEEAAAKTNMQVELKAVNTVPGPASREHQPEKSTELKKRKKTATKEAPTIHQEKSNVGYAQGTTDLDQTTQSTSSVRKLPDPAGTPAANTKQVKQKALEANPPNATPVKQEEELDELGLPSNAFAGTELEYRRLHEVSPKPELLPATLKRGRKGLLRAASGVGFVSGSSGEDDADSDDYDDEDLTSRPSLAAIEKEEIDEESSGEDDADSDDDEDKEEQLGQKVENKPLETLVFGRLPTSSISPKKPDKVVRDGHSASLHPLPVAKKERFDEEDDHLNDIPEMGVEVNAVQHRDGSSDDDDAAVEDHLEDGHPPPSPTIQIEDLPMDDAPISQEHQVKGMSEPHGSNGVPHHEKRIQRDSRKDQAEQSAPRLRSSVGFSAAARSAWTVINPSPLANVHVPRSRSTSPIHYSSSSSPQADDVIPESTKTAHVEVIQLSPSPAPEGTLTNGSTADGSTHHPQVPDVVQVASSDEEEDEELVEVIQLSPSPVPESTLTSGSAADESTHHPQLPDVVQVASSDEEEDEELVEVIQLSPSPAPEGTLTSGSAADESTHHPQVPDVFQVASSDEEEDEELVEVIQLSPSPAPEGTLTSGSAADESTHHPQVPDVFQVASSDEEEDEELSLWERLERERNVLDENVSIVDATSDHASDEEPFEGFESEDEDEDEEMMDADPGEARERATSVFPADSERHQSPRSRSTSSKPDSDSVPSSDEDIMMVEPKGARLLRVHIQPTSVAPSASKAQTSWNNRAPRRAPTNGAHANHKPGPSDVAPPVESNDDEQVSSKFASPDGSDDESYHDPEEKAMTSDPPGFIKPKSLRSGPTTPGKRTAATSHHFATPISSRNANATPTSSQKKIRPPPGTVSSIPFPPISAPEFGLIQEKLANDPFALLVAVNFLNKTKGTVAIPRFWSFLPDYPTPEDLATAEVAEVADTIRSLGLHNNRARTLIAMARTWVEQPPEGGKRHRRLNYPHRGAGKGIRRGEVIGDDADDDRFGAWEVAHLPGCGPYALDSWRIFCRDKLRGVGSDYNDARLLEPEWKRVVPRDKELRAFLRWMWLREGWVWDPLTGEKEVAGEEVLEKARRGEIVWDLDDAGEAGTGASRVREEDADVKPKAEPLGTLEGVARRVWPRMELTSEERGDVDAEDGGDEDEDEDEDEDGDGVSSTRPQTASEGDGDDDGSDGHDPTVQLLGMLEDQIRRQSQEHVEEAEVGDEDEDDMADIMELVDDVLDADGGASPFVELSDTFMANLQLPVDPRRSSSRAPSVFGARVRIEESPQPGNGVGGRRGRVGGDDGGGRSEDGSDDEDEDGDGYDCMRGVREESPEL